MKAINIIWDTTDKNIALPTEIKIPDEMIYEDEISDYISDKTGYAIKGFALDYNGMRICCPNCGNEIDIEFDTARCPECNWLCADSELDDLMTI